MSGVLKVGAKAPRFRLQDETQAWVSLDDLGGKRVVLFFYQKANTPGCTVEACEFRDLMPRFAADGVVVFGVSPDTWRTQAKFKAAQRLSYPLLVDTDALTCQAYGVWQQKLFWGRYYMGVIRSTFVIGPDGRLEKEWRDVHHEGHAAAVSAWLRGEPEPVREVVAKTRPSKAPAKAQAKPKAKAKSAASDLQAARKK